MTPSEWTERHAEVLNVAGRGYYRLDGHTPVECTDLYEWGRAFETQDRRVAITKFGRVDVITSFIAIDHGYNFGADPAFRPVLFETMVFGGPQNEYMERYCTWDEAAAGHAEVAALIEDLLRRIARYDDLRERTPRSALPKRAPFRRRYAPREFPL